MLNVHSKYSELIKDVFKADQSFVGALDKACSAIVNYRPVPKQPVRAPELVNFFKAITVLVYYHITINLMCLCLFSWRNIVILC